MFPEKLNLIAQNGEPFFRKWLTIISIKLNLYFRCGLGLFLDFFFLRGSNNEIFVVNLKKSCTKSKENGHCGVLLHKIIKFQSTIC